MLKQLYWDLQKELNTRRQVTALKHSIKHDEPLILVHQPGRVGSMTIYNTTASLGLPQPIYHTHFINWQKLQQRFTSYQKHYGSVKQRHMRVARPLAKALESNGYHGELKVVVTIREPLRRELSTFFLDIEKYHIPDFYTRFKKKQISLKQIRDTFLQDRRYLERDSWLDEEVRIPLGIDVYDQPFDFEKKFAIYRQNNISLLLFRIDDIKDTIYPAYQAFFGCAPPKIINKHVSNNGSQQGNAYNTIVSQLKFPRTFLEQLYQTRFARHFFSDDERRALVEIWAE